MYLKILCDNSIYRNPDELTLDSIPPKVVLETYRHQINCSSVRKQKTNHMVGIFSNGFIKLVQKTDRTHSKCHLFLVGGLPHKPTQATFFWWAQEKKAKSYPLKPRPLFSSDTPLRVATHGGWREGITEWRKNTNLNAWQSLKQFITD